MSLNLSPASDVPFTNIEEDDENSFTADDLDHLGHFGFADNCSREPSPSSDAEDKTANGGSDEKEFSFALNLDKYSNEESNEGSATPNSESKKKTKKRNNKRTKKLSHKTQIVSPETSRKTTEFLDKSDDVKLKELKERESTIRKKIEEWKAKKYKPREKNETETAAVKTETETAAVKTEMETAAVTKEGASCARLRRKIQTYGVWREHSCEHGILCYTEKSYKFARVVSNGLEKFGLSADRLSQKGSNNFEKANISKDKQEKVAGRTRCSKISSSSIKSRPVVFIARIKKEFEKLFLQSVKKEENEVFLQHVASCFNNRKYDNLFELILDVQKKIVSRLSKKVPKSQHSERIRRWKELEKKITYIKDRLQKQPLKLKEATESSNKSSEFSTINGLPQQDGIDNNASESSNQPSEVCTINDQQDVINTRVPVCCDTLNEIVTRDDEVPSQQNVTESNIDEPSPEELIPQLFQELELIKTSCDALLLQSLAATVRTTSSVLVDNSSQQQQQHPSISIKDIPRKRSPLLRPPKLIISPKPPVNECSLRSNDSSYESYLHHPVIKSLSHRNHFNPRVMDLHLDHAGFFIVKSKYEEDLYRSVVYSSWCCNNRRGNVSLDEAYKSTDGPVYLFFTLVDSGAFQGIARLASPFDTENSTRWYKCGRTGQFELEWLYVKDVEFGKLEVELCSHVRQVVGKAPRCKDTFALLPRTGAKIAEAIHATELATSLLSNSDVEGRELSDSGAVYGMEENSACKSRVDFPSSGTLKEHDINVNVAKNCDITH